MGSILEHYEACMVGVYFHLLAQADPFETALGHR
jgi:hypothetical protein